MNTTEAPYINVADCFFPIKNSLLKNTPIRIQKRERYRSEKYHVLINAISNRFYRGIPIDFYQSQIEGGEKILLPPIEMENVNPLALSNVFYTQLNFGIDDIRFLYSLYQEFTSPTTKEYIEKKLQSQSDVEEFFKLNLNKNWFQQSLESYHQGVVLFNFLDLYIKQGVKQ